MGWCNFIVVPKLKLALQVSRDVSQIEGEEYSKDFDRITDSYDYDDGVEETKVNELTVKQLSALVKSYQQLQVIAGDVDPKQKLLFSSLRAYDRNAQIVSELDAEEMKKLREQGFVFVEYDLGDLD